MANCSGGVCLSGKRDSSKEAMTVLLEGSMRPIICVRIPGFVSLGW